MFDALTLSAIVDEVSPEITGGRIQRVLLLDDLTLGLEIYADHQRHQLLVSAHARDARLHLVSARLTPDRARMSPFLLLMRKYARGGQILSIEQPPLERTVKVSIAKRLPLDKQAEKARSIAAVQSTNTSLEAVSDDLAVGDEADDDLPGYEVIVHLIVELMGRHSNVVLVDATGHILDSIKRVPASVNRYRTVLPHRQYVAPPEQAKADPRLVTTAWWRKLLDQPGEVTAQVLVRELRGISPQVAREVVFRAAKSGAGSGGLSSAEAYQASLTSVLDHVERHSWSPQAYRFNQRFVAFSPFPLVSMTEHEAIAYPFMSAAVEAFFGESEAVTGHSQSRTQLLARLTAERDRIRARRASLDTQLQAAEASEQLRRSGEMIYAYLHTLLPGQRQLVVDDFMIELDPDLPAVANAQRYFDRYRRARAASANLPKLVEAVDLELAYYDQLELFASQAESLAELQAVEAEWKSHGLPTPNLKKPAPAKAPRRLQTTSGEVVLIGRSGVQNEKVTFALAGPDDLWLHARGLPGAHVILRPRPGPAAPAGRAIEAAAQLAAYYSPAREASAVEVDVTPRRWVRKVKGGPPGLVTYRNEYTVRVAPCSEATLRERGLLAQ